MRENIKRLTKQIETKIRSLAKQLPKQVRKIKWPSGKYTEHPVNHIRMMRNAFKKQGAKGVADYYCKLIPDEEKAKLIREQIIKTL